MAVEKSGRAGRHYEGLLYPDIAKQYKTTASKVERAIRHAIESVWKKNGPQIYFEIAQAICRPTEKPTNGQFIAALSEYFRIKRKGKSKNQLKINRKKKGTKLVV